MRSLYRQVVKELEKVSDCAEFEAGVIFEELFGADYRLRLIKDGDISVGDDDINRLYDMIDRRKSGEPLQYIVGAWEFYGMTLSVAKGALIPRQDTETLLETALELIRGTESPKVLDLCSGTGCVALAVKKARPDSDVTALEKYPEAYKILLENIKRYPGVTAVSADALSEDTAAGFFGYDIITANPPYLTKCDMENLQAEVRAEPKEALYGGDDGLMFYRALPRIWCGALKPGGHIAFEIGLGQQEDVKKLLADAGYGRISERNDLAGRARVIYAEKI